MRRHHLLLTALALLAALSVSHPALAQDTDALTDPDSEVVARDEE